MQNTAQTTFRPRSRVFQPMLTKCFLMNSHLISDVQHHRIQHNTTILKSSRHGLFPPPVCFARQRLGMLGVLTKLVTALKNSADRGGTVLTSTFTVFAPMSRKMLWALMCSSMPAVYASKLCFARRLATGVCQVSSQNSSVWSTQCCAPCSVKPSVARTTGLHNALRARDLPAPHAPGSARLWRSQAEFLSSVRLPAYFHARASKTKKG